MKKSAALGLAAAAALTCVAGVGGPASASPIVQTTIVSTNPAEFLPRITSTGAVYKMLQLGSVMYVGGSFTQVKSATYASTYDRPNFLSFDANTGAMTSVRVAFNGPVWALATDGTSIYAGGEFTTVNGVARRGLVKLSTSGVVDTSFNAGLTGYVYEAAYLNGRIIVSGTFGKKLQAVDRLTGKDTGYINISIIGQNLPTNSGPVKVYRFSINPAGTRLAMVGTFTSVGGKARRQAAMVNLGTSSATVSNWYSPMWDKPCSSAAPAYTRDVDFSPDGSYFVIVSTGAAGGTTKLCDSASKWLANDLVATRPAWVNYTGGDTLLSVVVTQAAVYVQGHQRWLDNPYGTDSAGPGALSRPGIGAINPSTGKALSWNPTKDRGVGGRDLLLTAKGLWVGSDTTHIGGEVHERIALLPLP